MSMGYNDGMKDDDVTAHPGGLEDFGGLVPGQHLEIDASDSHLGPDTATVRLIRPEKGGKVATVKNLGLGGSGGGKPFQIRASDVRGVHAR